MFDLDFRSVSDIDKDDRIATIIINAIIGRAGNKKLNWFAKTKIFLEGLNFLNATDEFLFIFVRQNKQIYLINIQNIISVQLIICKVVLL